MCDIDYVYNGYDVSLDNEKPLEKIYEVVKEICIKNLENYRNNKLDNKTLNLAIESLKSDPKFLEMFTVKLIQIGLDINNMDKTVVAPSYTENFVSSNILKRYNELIVTK
jgi:hypothetical protein